MGLHKILKYLMLALSVVAAFFFIFMLAKGDAAVSTDATTQNITVTPLLWISYLIMLFATLLVLVFVMKGLFSDPAKLKRFGLILVASAIIMVIAYVTASGDDAALFNESIDFGDDPLTAGESRFIGASLNTFYIVGFLSIAVLVWSNVSKFFKK